ncbi:hypothetical protein SAMN02745165_02004 [Malonomonas rubra DSM 5091]|uniref:Lipid A deacylase LpxR family protein n=1 Tax=Malonomonas rubra DSM 5091 TaxID=1122189 RepID=A0A1M6I439_MALRU|nr:lipid A deacylase LpxR family protein [Malonomonas rubra]SHJ29231.1 hypothetical protein SAMN02745165_02004 [Malonomonas rubra DSM 5091]
MRRKLILFILLLLPFNLFAAENPWTHNLYFENDLFFGTDSDYTNGVKYSFISPDLAPDAPVNVTGKIPRTALNFIHNLPLIKNAPAETGHKLEFGLGQNMYTPRDISRYDLIEDDRPYAGYSYLSTSYHRKSEDGDGWSQMDTLEVQLGIVGPSSLAEQSQKFVHRVRALQRPNGWDHQLEDEPALLLAFERKWLYHPTYRQKFCTDLIGHAGLAIGNVMTYLNAGGEVRFGWNIPRSFSVSQIRPAGSNWLTTTRGFSSYLFAAVNGRAVLLDIFLDGNNFRDSHSVDKEPLVADLMTGITVRYQRVSFSFAYTHRTREFKRQPEHHGFGSMTLSYVF